jgi:8-oxo-dGTP pyrophosphatase MutT (NUDIX family)
MWHVLSVADRRFSVAMLRAACADLPAPGRRTHLPVDDPKPAATLVPVVDVGGEAALVLTKRPSTMTHHRNDWVFPGGRVDARFDSSSAAAALREVHEELGIDPSEVDVIGQLTTHGPISTGYVIDVFVGVVSDVSLLAPDPREVAEMTVMPISALLAEGVHSRSHTMPVHNTGPTVLREDVQAPVDLLNEVTEPLHLFMIRDDEWLWGTQGSIAYELLDHLVSRRSRFD